MSEKPILFSGAMVRAILEGRKCQTRRVVKFPPAPMKLGTWEPTTIGGPGTYLDKACTKPAGPAVTVMWHTRNGATVGCPYGHAGDRLWVRENGWQRIGASGSFDPYYFDASMTEAEIAYLREHAFRFRRRPSIHMPRRFCRLVLEVTAVRVERLQEISRS